MPITNERRREIASQKRARIKFLEANDQSHPELLAHRAHRKKINSQIVAFQKKNSDWLPEYHRILGWMKTAFIQENPNSPEAIKRRDSNKSKSDKILKWMSENPDDPLVIARRESLLENSRRFYGKHPGYSSSMYHKNFKQRLKKEPALRVLANMRKRTRRALKSGIAGKYASTLNLLGCNLDYFMKYMEKKFQPGMSWENYGHRGWHIDHRRPCASFNLQNEEDQRWCFHYSNLQPLWATDNIRKQAKYSNPNSGRIVASA